MSRLAPALGLVALLIASPAAAACYADYKAKRDAPLQLHYGVIQVDDASCSPEAAAADIRRRIAADGWELLTVVSVFDESGLSGRQDTAGPFFLRY